MKIIIVLIMILAIMSVGSLLHQNQDEGINTNITIENYTSRLYWNSSNVQPLVDEGNVNLSEVTNMRISSMIYKFVDFVGFTSLEISKYFLEVGYNNYEHNFIYWIKLLIAIALLPLVIPTIVILTLLGMSIKNLYNKFKNKREEDNKKGGKKTTRSSRIKEAINKDR